MRRLLALLAVLLLLTTPLWGRQPFPTQIQIAINQLTTGVTVFTNLRNAASAYVNWGATSGTSGYGIRDSSGSMQFKNSGGSWQDFVGGSSSGAPADATYWVRTANATLSNETIMGSLGTGLVINTTTTGVPTIYAGASCTNQFPRSLSAIGAATCASVSLTADTTGTLTVAKGGTGLTSGISGGILGFTASGTLASSGALTASALLLGGGAGATPSALGSLGTSTTVLHGNASGAPTFGAVALSSDISGFGTGIATALAINTGSAGAPVLFNGALGTPSSGTLTNATSLPIIAGTTGTLSLARGGTGQVLVDPGADRILFWDDSGNAVTWLTAGTGLQIVGTTLSATTTAVGGSNTQLQFNDGGVFGGDADLTWNKTTNILTWAGTVFTPDYIANYAAILAATNTSIYIASNNDGNGSFIDMGLPGAATEGFNLGYASSTRFTTLGFSDTGSLFTRDNTSPTGLVETLIAFSYGDGDAMTAIGTRTFLATAADHPSVTAMTKGLLYGIGCSVQPIQTRNITGIDDATCLAIGNGGTKAATDAIWFRQNASVTDTYNWNGGLIVSEAKALYGIRMFGTMATGIDVEEVTGTIGVFKATEATDAVFTFAADQGDDATDTWTLKVLASGNSMTWTNNSNVRLTLDTAGVLSPVTVQPTTSYKSVDGTTGATVTTCTGFKNGLCISGT